MGPGSGPDSDDTGASGGPGLPGEPARPGSFHFLSRWQVRADRRRVWDALVDFQRWPEWWPGLRDVEQLRPGGPDGIGQKATSHWQAPLGYHLEITIEAVERAEPDRLKGIASGDLEGFGSWDLTAADQPAGEPPAAGDPVPGGWTTVCFRWAVSPTRRWMIALVPIARPLFVKGHDHVMEGGAEGLAAHLGCEIRDFHSRSA